MHTAIGSWNDQATREAVEWAVLQGLVKRGAAASFAHIPFALTPFSIPLPLEAQLVALTPVFNRLVHAISRDASFLHTALEGAAKSDPFTRSLLQLSSKAPTQQELQFQIIRSDCFLQSPQKDRSQIRQVELNTIASSYAAAASCLYRLHAQLMRNTPQGEVLLTNDPLSGIVEGFVRALAAYGYPDAVVLMVVQPAESNVFDQRLLEQALVARGVVVLRMSLSQIGAQAMLRQGHLLLGEKRVGIVYFRAGYAPADHEPPGAFKGRELIHNSSAISVPNITTQLAGTKKVQQLLTQRALLERFSTAREAEHMETAFARMYDPEQMLDTPGGPRPAWEVARAAPADFVLKPQREGGNNNIYHAELAAFLNSAPPQERQAYVLMERIRPLVHPVIAVRDGETSRFKGVSEIGRYGVYLAQGEEVLYNQDVGYLVRTKAENVDEGGVAAGFACLNSLSHCPSP